jgi:hypothetical protein
LQRRISKLYISHGLSVDVEIGITNKDLELLEKYWKGFEGVILKLQ